jgi:hypothetical protein
MGKKEALKVLLLTLGVHWELGQRMLVARSSPVETMMAPVH